MPYSICWLRDSNIRLMHYHSFNRCGQTSSYREPQSTSYVYTYSTSLVFATVIFSVINAIPVGIYTESRGIEGFRKYYVEVWPKPIFRLAYSVFTFAIHFLLHLLVSSGLYLDIYNRLAFRPEQFSLPKESGRRKRRTKTLLACVIICFVICWTPWCVLSTSRNRCLCDEGIQCPTHSGKLFRVDPRTMHTMADCRSI